MNKVDNKTGRSQLQKKAGKYLAIFMILMVLFTAVSRISASLTVPLVSTQKASKSTLTYKIGGDGRIDSANAVYIDLFANLQVAEVYVKKGQGVKEGDRLFCYDLEQLKEQIEEAENEYEKSKSAYEKVVLTASLENESADGSEEEKAVKRAKEDYQEAKDSYKEAKEKYKEKLALIKSTLSKTQKEEYEKAQEEYDLAKQAYEETKETYEKQVSDAKATYSAALETKETGIKEAKEELAEVQSELDEVLLKKTTLIQYMNVLEEHAKSQKYSEMNTDLENIYVTYFGKSAYAEIKSKISDAQSDVTKAENNLKAVKARWKLTMEEAKRELAKVDSSDLEYDSALNRYKLQQLEEENAIQEASDAVDNAKKQLSNISTKYTEISEVATTYFYYLAGNPLGSDATLYKKYSTAILDSSIVDETAYRAKSKEVEKAKKAVEDVTKEQEKLVEKAKSAVNNITTEKKKVEEKEKAVMEKKAKAMDELLDKVYEDKDGIHAARESLEAQEDAVETAKRALEDAEDRLSDYRKSKSLETKNEEINSKIAKLEMEQLEKDIEAKAEVLETLNQIYDANGEVLANIDGLVTTIDIEQRAMLVGNEKVIITPSCSVFVGSFEKDYLEYVQNGDEVSCQITGWKKSVSGEVIDITYNIEGDCYDMTAKLPEGDYAPGAVGQFVITKVTERYDNCIPITALRSDNSGTYVFAMREISTVLGKEFKAYRVNVVVDRKDYQTAVINDILDSDEEIIIGSNRNIMEGDRVRKGTYE
ncbi:biotin/lipoyl-binding protein [Anaerosporobacter sp.]|uniref:biotin/lipoyl-binding protein n=1 Tax=Anaerosporobacter sp. TaxID=1872529 RepID=UPI00286F5748|nr:biotin/lipoyl-binding protein [Anaerosporobacter sp.]